MWIFKCAATTTFIKGNTPTIFMGSCTTTTLNQTGKTETDIRGHVRAHPQQLAHHQPPLLRTAVTKIKIFGQCDWR
ncbi:glutamine amidotransferase yafJ [Yersinia ruckeri ATCC 29473]|nr:glutamine amidotransferase yafJ [Yersinia ruckeri ATCC 29473]